MRYTLIEDWTPDTTLPEDTIHVALTQHAISQLRKQSVPYVTLEDFYTSGEIRGDVDHFLHEQLGWFADLDSYFQKLYPLAAELQVDLASLYYYWIKYAVDNVILTTRILKRFLTVTAPDKIFFIHTAAPADEIEHILSFRNMESTYSLLIRQICENKNIAFQRITNPMTEGAAEQKKTFKVPGWFALLKEKARYVHNSLRNFKHLRKTTRPIIEEKRVKVFLLKSSYYILDFCREARDRGFEFYVLEGNHIIRYDAFRRKKVLDIDRDFISDVVTDEVYCQAVAGKGFSEIFNWINSQCGLDGISALASRLKKFSEDVCPRILALIPGFIKFYQEHQIDYVATPSIWSLEDHAAIAAARKTPHTKSVGFNHGIDAFEAKSRFFKVTRFYDYFFVSTREEMEHEHQMVQEFGYERPRVYPAKYFTNKCAEITKLRSSNLNYRIQGKPVAVFVPIMCVPWPNRPVELTQPFPMEYVKWHLALSDFMAQQKKWHFIWKGLFQPNQEFDLMDDYIKQNKYDNVSFQSGDLSQWLSVASRVVCDSPSTAYFEAMLSGVPVLSLYRPQDQRLRANAIKTYGVTLAPYSSIDEGLKKVREFLKCDSAKFLVPIQEFASKAPDILKAHRVDQDT